MVSVLRKLLIFGKFFFVRFQLLPMIFIRVFLVASVGRVIERLVDSILGVFPYESVIVCDDGQTHTFEFPDNCSATTECDHCKQPKWKTGRRYLFMDPIAAGGLIHLWAQSPGMCKEMLNVFEEMRKRDAPEFKASSSLGDFFTGTRFVEVLSFVRDCAAKKCVPTLWLSYFDNFTMTKKRTKSGGICSLLPVGFSSFARSIQDLEIPVAFFAPARVSEQKQQKLFDFSYYMKKVLRILKHLEKGESVHSWALDVPALGIRAGDSVTVKGVVVGTAADEVGQGELHDIHNHNSKDACRFGTLRQKLHKYAPTSECPPREWNHIPEGCESIFWFDSLSFPTS
jgi:hypothetical protein